MKIFKILILSFCIIWGFLFKGLFSCYVEKFEKYNKTDINKAQLMIISENAQFLTVSYYKKEGSLFSVYDLYNKKNKIVYSHESKNKLYAINFCKYNNYLVASYEDGSIIVHDINLKKIIYKIKHSSVSHHVKISPFGKYIVVFCLDDSIILYDISGEGKFFILKEAFNKNFKQTKIKACICSFSENERYFAYINDHEKVVLYDAINNEKFCINISKIKLLYFSNCSNYLYYVIKKQIYKLDIKKAFYSTLKNTLNLKYFSCGDIWTYKDLEFKVIDIVSSFDGACLVAYGKHDLYFYNPQCKKGIAALTIKIEDKVDREEICFVYFSSYKNYAIIVCNCYCKKELKLKSKFCAHVVDLDEIKKEDDDFEVSEFYIDDFIKYCFFSKSGRYFVAVGKNFTIFDLKNFKKVFAYNLRYIQEDLEDDYLFFDGSFINNNNIVKFVDTEEIQAFKVPPNIYLKEKKEIFKKEHDILFKKNLVTLLVSKKLNNKFSDISIKTKMYAHEKLKNNKKIIKSKNGTRRSKSLSVLL